MVKISDLIPDERNANNVQILANGGEYSTTDELCRNVDKSANAHSNYRQPTFCQYIVIGSCRIIKMKYQI